jgi:RNA polymerase sigma-70 factor (ECF subfamily)
MRRHFRAAWAIALSIVRDPIDAEDVCQDAFVRAWQRLDQCRKPARFRAWLLSVVRSVALNRLRAEKLRATSALSAAVGMSTPDSTATHVRQSEIRQQLLAAFDQLGDTERSVLLLRDLEQWSHREIAETLDISEMMSRRHLSDARRKTREWLRSRGLSEEIP